MIGCQRSPIASYAIAARTSAAADLTAAFSGDEGPAEQHSPRRCRRYSAVTTVPQQYEPALGYSATFAAALGVNHDRLATKNSARLTDDMDTSAASVITSSCQRFALDMPVALKIVAVYLHERVITNNVEQFRLRLIVIMICFLRVGTADNHRPQADVADKPA